MRLRNLLALDDSVEGGGASEDVIGLYGKHFAKCVSGAMTEERPDFHFSEALTSILGLTAERLLSDERVRSDRSHVDLVFDHVVKLKHIHVADGDILVKGFARSSVEELDLAVLSDARLDELFLDIGFGSARERRYDSLVIQSIR